ncbi:MAG: hypothetical protein QW625_02140 [Candidatus Nanoarchaeia archaeon]
MAEKLKSKQLAKQEKEFLKAFTKQIALAKEKIKSEKEKEEREKAREAAKKRIEKIKEKIKASIAAEKERKLTRKKIEELALEKEKIEAKAEKEAKAAEVTPAPKPIPSAVLPPPTSPTPIAPIYRRALPPLPQPPKLTPSWPLPPPPRITKKASEVIPEAPKPKIALATTIDLGKLNPFIQDASVTLIQCEGSNLPIKIIKEDKTFETAVKLTEDEIKDIIYKFAARAGLSIAEPVFKATIGKLTITAVTSTFAGSKFVISKS